MFDKYKNYREYRDIKMPEDMKNDILMSMQEYKPAKKKMTRRKRTVIIAAVLSVVMIMSATALSNYEVIFIDFEGNLRTVLFTVRSENEEMRRFEDEIWSETNENSIFYIISADSNISFRMSEIKFEDYKELKDYLKNFDDEIYKLPEHIPDGYTFKEAAINFYLSENINYDELEPIYYEEKFGNIYELYELPQLSGKINRVRIVYNKGGRNIQYWISFASPHASDFGGLSAPVSVEPELLDIAQFDNSVIVAYKNSRKQDWHFTAMKNIEPFNALFDTAASKTWRNNNINMGENGFNTVIELGKAVYRILGNPNISRDEIIKMAESIK